jgi:hypothetical protein
MLFHRYAFSMFNGGLFFACRQGIKAANLTANVEKIEPVCPAQPRPPRRSASLGDKGVLAAAIAEGHDFRCGSSTDLTAPKFDFRFTPETGLKSDITPCPFRAKTGSRSRLIDLCGSPRIG